MTERYHLDLEAYVRATQAGPCFICEIVASNPAYRHHIVYQDDTAVAFLNKYPPLYGYVLVAPKAHREQVTGDLSLAEYLALQRVIYWAAEAVRQETAAERVYLLSLGSQQGNRHVHWHVAPLPPGVPYMEQQLGALDAAKTGVLKLSEEEMSALAGRIGARMARLMAGSVG
jgi:diadenosine tetraphosphate (Ap4A) HIT family hydrolase